MMERNLKRALLFAGTFHTTVTTAQYGPGGQYGPGSNNGGNSYNYGQPNNNNGGPSSAILSSRHKALLAHAILASLAFVLIFPSGSILVRLGTSRHTWLVHGLLQLTGYIVYTAAFGLGVYLIQNIPVDILATPQNYHPIIGIVLFVALFFQPILGWLHHVRFKKLGHRTWSSHAHVWFGRILITLGIVNGGLGLLLASDAPAFTGFAPRKAQCVAYGVVAGIMWLAWVAASIVGERRRSNAGKGAQGEKGIGMGSDEDSVRSRGEERGRGRLGEGGYGAAEMGVRTPPAYKERDGRFA